MPRAIAILAPAPAPDEYPPTATEGLDSDAPLWRTQLQPFAIWRDEIAGRSSIPMAAIATGDPFLGSRSTIRPPQWVRAEPLKRSLRLPKYLPD